MFGLPQRQAAESADDFKKRFEQEHDERIELVIVASHVVSSHPAAAAGTASSGSSGVLLLTDKAVHFIPMQSYHWLDSMLRQGGAQSGTDISLRIEIADIVSVSRDKRGFWDTLFGASNASFTVLTGQGASERFATPMPEDFIARLQSKTGASPD